MSYRHIYELLNTLLNKIFLKNSLFKKNKRIAYQKMVICEMNSSLKIVFQIYVLLFEKINNSFLYLD